MRIILAFILAFSFTYANTKIDLKKGWQLIGVPVTLQNMSQFNNSNVEIVWGYNGASQNWNGYSPDARLQSEIKAQAFSTLSSLQPWQAVWVFSKNDWSLNFEENLQKEHPNNNEIKLYKGWNLVEVPQQSVVSDDFFGDAVIWKYSSEQEWKVNNKNLNFPTIDSIATSEGLWVKSATTRTIDVDAKLSKLHTFNNEASMLEYIRKMLLMQDYYSMPYLNSDNSVLDGTITTPDSNNAKDATTTNLQEIGVDESDILKHNGTHIFSVNNGNSSIFISSFEKIAVQDYSPIAQITLNNKNITAMYLQNKHLSVISNQTLVYADKPTQDDATSMIAPDFNTQKFILDIFDVSDIQNIHTISSHQIDGYYQDSRLINGKLFLISQFTPSVEYKYNKIYIHTPCSSINKDEIGVNCSVSSIPTCINGDDECLGTELEYKEVCEYGSEYEFWKDNSCDAYQYDERGAWKYDYDKPIIISQNLIPMLTSNGTTSNLITPSRFYAPNKLDQRASITSITSFDVLNGTLNETLSFLGNTHTSYASTNSLYLISSEYPLYFDYSHYKEQQMIYKFSLGNAISYEGRGFVEGRVLNQFSMSEKDEYLRIATTSGWSWWSDGETTNTVYTLKNRDGALEVEGKLLGLGHENETIRAVRFMGDRGFVVTFEQTDPLYTLDLSDPQSPQVVGELEIPGFSSYLHVVDENRVLSVGRNANEAGEALELQFQLFDISDFTNPKLVDRLRIGNQNSFSEAEYNHKAFAYRASDLTFGIPYREISYDENTQINEYFSVYQIDGMHINTISTLALTPFNQRDSSRGIIFDINNSTYGALFKGSDVISKILK